jgi:hypothetical protein
MRLPSNGIGSFMMARKRLSFITLALTLSRSARDLNTMYEYTTVSPRLSLTLRGNDVRFPTFTSSATHSRKSSAPQSRQILAAFLAMRR